MNISQVTAGLELIGCSIRNLSIKNGLIDLREDDELHLNIDIQPIYNGIEKQEHHGRVILTLDIEAIRIEKEEQKAEITVSFEALFRSTNQMDETDFIQMLMINGATALYSIARGKMEVISASVFLEGKIVLPFVNIYQYYIEKEKEAKE